MIGRGAEKQLLLFLSGAGGCGKSHVINAVQGMCQHFCRCINKGFDSSAFLVTASTNSAATLIGGSTIHSVAQLRSKFSNVSINGKNIKIIWINANLIIIDEISNEDNLDDEMLLLLSKKLRTSSYYTVHLTLQFIENKDFVTSNFFTNATLTSCPLLSSKLVMIL